MKKERRKRKHWSLSEDQKTALNTFDMTVDELARSIGITYHQLSNPLSGNGGCSKDTYLKITRFLAKQEGK